MFAKVYLYKILMSFLFLITSATGKIFPSYLTAFSLTLTRFIRTVCLIMRHLLYLDFSRFIIPLYFCIYSHKPFVNLEDLTQSNLSAPYHLPPV